MCYDHDHNTNHHHHHHSFHSVFLIQQYTIHVISDFLFSKPCAVFLKRKYIHSRLFYLKGIINCKLDFVCLCVVYDLVVCTLVFQCLVICLTILYSLLQHCHFYVTSTSPCISEYRNVGKHMKWVKFSVSTIFNILYTNVMSSVNEYCVSAITKFFLISVINFSINKPQVQ